MTLFYLGIISKIMDSSVQDDEKGYTEKKWPKNAVIVVHTCLSGLKHAQIGSRFPSDIPFIFM